MKNWIAILTGYIALIILAIFLYKNGAKNLNSFQQKIDEKQKQIDVFELSNKELFVKIKIIQDSFDFYKNKQDSLQNILNTRPHAKDPNSVNDLPIDSTVSFLSEWLSKKN